MVSIMKDKNNKSKYFIGDESYCNEETSEESKIKNCNEKKRNPFPGTSQKLTSNNLVGTTKKNQDFQILNCNIEGEGSRDEVISVFVKTSRKLQDMVRGYEAKVNQTTAHITCLQHHVSNLHEQLAHKNKTIGKVCERYVTLSREKKASEEHLQKKIDDLTRVMEACVNNDTPQVQQLLVQQLEKNRYLEYQNEILSQRIMELCRPLTDPKGK